MIRYLFLREHPELAECAALWFHQKWHVPLSAYQQSITQCLENKCTVPQWYLAMQDDVIVGGIGVIDNDFHQRKDLTPNVCAVYVEKSHRCRGIAGRLLKTVCDDMAQKGIGTLYLCTDHTSFYERYGWQYYGDVLENSGESTRMYVHCQ